MARRHREKLIPVHATIQYWMHVSAGRYSELDIQARYLDKAGAKRAQWAPAFAGAHRLHAFEDRGDALPAADAHGDQRVALLRALEFVERLHREDRAGGAYRMP